MIDTSIKEYTAEDFITYTLQRFGIYIAKPKFDVNGTDLFAMLNFSSETGNVFKYCRIQCKYRSLTGKGKNLVSIPESYVNHDFIVFLYIEDGNFVINRLYCFFWEDIKSNSSPWKLQDGQFNLSLNIRNFEKDLIKYAFDKTKVEKIRKRIETSFQVIESVHGFVEGKVPIPKLEAKMHVED